MLPCKISERNYFIPICNFDNFFVLYKMIGGATIQRDFATLIRCILVRCVLLNISVLNISRWSYEYKNSNVQTVSDTIHQINLCKKSYKLNKAKLHSNRDHFCVISKTSDHSFHGEDFLMFSLLRS